MDREDNDDQPSGKSHYSTTKLDANPWARSNSYLHMRQPSGTEWIDRRLKYVKAERPPLVDNIRPPENATARLDEISLT